MSLPNLTLQALTSESGKYAALLSVEKVSALYKDGGSRTVGNHIQKGFETHLKAAYAFSAGNTSLGLDIPSLGVDVKATLSTKPQSSVHYETTLEKIFGLKYGLLLFAYTPEKDDNTRTVTLKIDRVVFVHADQTADYSTTKALNEIIQNQGNMEDIAGFLESKFPELDEDEANQIVERLLRTGSLTVGYLGLTWAPQWRVHYSIAIRNAGQVSGVELIYP